MNWIKVTPETMPPEMDEVFVTVEDENGKRYVMSDCRYNPQYGWEWQQEPCYEYWVDVSDKVTHWMPYPKPAED